jgi:hypothetical protein
MNNTRRLGILAGCVAASAAFAGPSAAKPILHERFHDEGTFVNEDFCGFAVSESYDVDGMVMAERHGKDGFAYFLDHVTETSVLTNLDDGRTLTFVGKGGSSKDLKVTDNHDGTLTVLVRQLGNDVFYGPDGKAIARNPGQIRFNLTIDHGGTPTDPSDDEVIGFELVKESTGRSDDVCAAVQEAWG